VHNDEEKNTYMILGICLSIMARVSTRRRSEWHRARENEKETLPVLVLQRTSRLCGIEERISFLLQSEGCAPDFFLPRLHHSRWLGSSPSSRTEISWPPRFRANFPFSLKLPPSASSEFLTAPGGRVPGRVICSTVLESVRLLACYFRSPPHF
jgi:hypothetical protein